MLFVYVWMCVCLCVCVIWHMLHNEHKDSHLSSRVRAFCLVLTTSKLCLRVKTWIGSGQNLEWVGNRGQKPGTRVNYVHVGAHKNRDLCIHLYTEYVYVCVFLLACLCTLLMTPTEPWIFAPWPRRAGDRCLNTILSTGRSPKREEGVTWDTSTSMPSRASLRHWYFR